LTQARHPSTPEELMRSRYTAFTLDDIDYIKATSAGNSREAMKEAKRDASHPKISWTGLEIVATKPGSNILGFVEFIASYIQSGLPQILHENSEFKKIKGRWFYTDGQILAS
jgi:SEC-C motif-containing protein